MLDWFARFRALSLAVREYDKDPRPEAWDKVWRAAGMPVRCKQPTVDVREFVRNLPKE